MTYEMTEIERRLANMVQTGIVTEIDYGGQPRAKVRIADFETPWLRMGMRRAGDAVESWAYSPGEEVLVMSPSGDLAQGVIVCAIANGANAAAAEPEYYQVTFPDGASVEVDHGTMTLNAPGGLIVNGDIDATGNVTITGEVEASGDVVGQKISLASHTHGGVLPGGATTGAPQ